MKHPLTRGAALVAGTASLTVTALLATSTPAVAGPVKDQKQATRWLSDQLTDGVVVNDQYDFTDYGLSIDTALGLRGQERRPAKVRQVRDALAGAVDSYTTGVDFDSEDVYAGATAKLASFVTLTGADPAAFGGVDLVERLEGLVSTEPASAGRIADVTTFADSANTIGQAFAAHALTEAGSDAAAPVTSYLLDQQCEAGYFRLAFTADDGAEDQTCDGGDPAGRSAPDTDVTALAVLSLAEIEDPSAEVLASIDAAGAWLAAEQRRNGSLGGGDPLTAAPNSNSTGLAGWVLGDLGYCGKAQQAARWVKKQQAGKGDKALSADKGAIAYDRPAYLQGKKDGITTQSRDQWRRATAQAAPSLDNLRKVECKA